MQNKNQNNEGNNILKFEDLFKEEIREKNKRDEPKVNKYRYIYALIGYIVVMFVFAAIIQLIFMSNKDNYEYYDEMDILLAEVSNDAYGMGLISQDAYEDYNVADNSYLDVYDSFENFILIYNTANEYKNVFLNEYPAQALLYNDLTLDGTWNGTKKMTLYVTKDIQEEIFKNFKNVSLIALDRRLLDEVSSNKQAYGFIDAHLYDTYYNDYSDNLAVKSFSNLYLVYNIDNPDAQIIENLSFDALDNYILKTTYNDGSDIVKFSYTNQQSTLFNPNATDHLVITSMDVQITGFINGLINFLIYIIALPILLFILKPNLSYDIDQTKRDGFGKLIVGSITGYVILIVGNLISNLLSTTLSLAFDHPIEEAVNQLTIENILHSNGAIFIILSAVIIGPVVEELVFRKSIFGLFKNQYVGLVVSALLFGSVHLLGEVSFIDGLINGISYIVMGFVFGIIYITNKKNIVYPIIVHIVSNLFSVVAVYFLQ